MRQIKFRVWTGEKMEYNIMAGFLGAFYVAGIWSQDSATMSPANTIYPDTCPVMQFTGLLDKNGKEIYEGDILGGHTSGIVTFSRGKFVGNYYDSNGSLNEELEDDLYHYAGKLEVIGNIHEHPDLLN